ncbi:MAG TPA: TraR/DksA C4-type zinc finger protein [Rubrobacteraceae bacterium]|jgi:DnaK suppressor protein|nr:TraR/DksA C4-type zinc finger protein [Rubrobacteraceae bacterium]
MATNTELDENFIAKQKERLQSLRDELLRIMRVAEEDERTRTEQDADFTEHDAGDMSRDIFDREVDATIVEQVEQRLAIVERAMQKIEEGTYGLSDVSGEPIPRGRLEAVPEAIRTVEEQQRFERERHPPF